MHGLPSVEGQGDRGFVEERRGFVRMIIPDSLRPHFKQGTYDELSLFNILYT